MARTKRTAKKTTTTKKIVRAKKTVVKKEKKEVKKTDKQLLAWQVATITLGVILIINLTMSNGLPKQVAADKSIDFINTYLLQGQATAVLKSVTEVKGLYMLNFTINGREFSSYITKDGELFFPQGLPMKALPTQTVSNEIPKSDYPTAMLFTMSFCPYGNQAEDGIIPAINLLKDDIEVVPHYVIYSNYGTGYPDYCIDENNTYCSMHGIQELRQDVRELCVYTYDKSNYWAFVKAINGNCTATNVDSCWEGVANDLGINTTLITNCYNNEATSLLARELALNKQYSVSGSPTLIINNAVYSGSRTPEAYKTALCSAFTNEPSACNETLSTTGSAADGSC